MGMGAGSEWLNGIIGAWHRVSTQEVDIFTIITDMIAAKGITIPTLN
jgi:hypothetical protein